MIQIAECAAMSRRIGLPLGVSLTGLPADAFTVSGLLRLYRCSKRHARITPQMAGQQHQQQLMWDRFDLEVFCQHCGQYLTTRGGLDRKQLVAAREEVRREAVAHAATAGHAIEVTWYITLCRAEMIAPSAPAAPSGS